MCNKEAIVEERRIGATRAERGEHPMGVRLNQDPVRYPTVAEQIQKDIDHHCAEIRRLCNLRDKLSGHVLGTSVEQIREILSSSVF